MLDVATGSGNAAIAAARLGCTAVGVDYVPALLERSFAGGRRGASRSSCIVEGQPGNDLLDVFGNGASEAIDVSADGGRLRFFRNVGNATLDLDDIESVSFRAAGGADTITVNDLAGPDAASVDKDLNAIGGGGDAQIAP